MLFLRNAGNDFGIFLWKFMCSKLEQKPTDVSIKASLSYNGLVSGQMWIKFGYVKVFAPEMHGTVIYSWIQIEIDTNEESSLLLFVNPRQLASHYAGF